MRHAPGAAVLQRAERGRASVSVRHRLAGVAGLYLVYLGFYFVMGEATFAAGKHVWHEVLATAVTGLLVLHARRASEAPMRGFLLALAVALALLMVADASYGRPYPLWRDAQGSALQLTDAAYGVFLFVWIGAWAGLVLALGVRRRPGARTAAVFCLLMGCFAALFAAFYTPLYRGALDTLPGRVGAATAALELLAVIAGMAAILLGVGNALVLLVFGLTLLASADMLYSDATMRQHAYAAAEPVWMLGLLLLMAGALVLPHAAQGRPGRQAFHAPAGASHRSGLSTLLLTLSLGAVLVSAVVSLSLRAGSGQGAAAVGEPFFFVLFSVTVVVVMVALTERFDHAIQHAERHAVRLFGQDLRVPDWRERDRDLAWIFEATGLAHLLDSLQATAARLHHDVIFLGPERLNPMPQAAIEGEPTCFIVMPFGQAASDDVHRALRRACLQVGLQPLRGDDIFTPTDILDDIWRGITASACVIADITGRNPNVMYELGIAHTLAKPVIILSRSAEDIPIDLSTRRVILYETTPEQVWPDRLEARVRVALQSLLQQFPVKARPLEPPVTGQEPHGLAAPGRQAESG